MRRQGKPGAATVEARRRKRGVEDPGPARGNDNCAAAWQGNIVAAEREGQRRAAAAAEEAQRNRGDTTPPSSPEYWRRRPEERAEHLARCDRMDEAAQGRFFCTPARQAAERAAAPSSAKPPRSARRT